MPVLSITLTVQVLVENIRQIKTMKIFISFMLKNKPTGGGNQFLCSLRNYFIAKGHYTTDASDADVVMFNSYQYIREVADFKCKRPYCIFVHRIDGPIRLYNRPSDRRDSVAYTAMDQVADGTVFQSEWSKKKNIDLGIPITRFKTTIINAPDSKIFNRSGCKSWKSEQKVRLVATSWSANWKKGFDVYQWLDQNLDFSRYEMIFIGNTPITFKNILHIPPLPTHELAEELKKSDIYITASKSDPCSNSLIEALHCGLPAIVRNDGGHPGIVGNGGEVFDRIEDIPVLIEKVAQNYEEYQAGINLPSMEEVGKAYYDFMYSIYEAVQKGEYIPKKLTLVGYFRVMCNLWLWEGHERLTGLQNQLVGKRQ